MRITTTWLLAITLFTSPQLLHAGDSAAAKTSSTNDATVQLKNVELSPKGHLTGQFVTSAGQAVVGQKLTMTVGKQKQTIETDAAGKFTAPVAGSGQCVIAVKDDVYACRVWTHGTAPPRSLKSVAIVQSTDSTVRGQLGRFGTFNPRARLMMLSTTQKVVLGVAVGIGAGIAIGDAIADDDKVPDAS